MGFNPLNAELNPICHLLALLGAHHIFHISRVRVNRNSFKISLIKNYVSCKKSALSENRVNMSEKRQICEACGNAGKNSNMAKIRQTLTLSNRQSRNFLPLSLEFG